MIIKNKGALSTTELRKQALDIIEAGIARVLPPAIMESAVSYDSSRRILTINGYAYHLAKGRIFVIGGGKAANLMAKGDTHPKSVTGTARVKRTATKELIMAPTLIAAMAEAASRRITLVSSSDTVLANPAAVTIQ